MTERKWSYKPGEGKTKRLMQSMSSPSDKMMEQFLNLSEAYCQSSEAKRTLVLNDNKEVVFFVQLDDNMMMTKKVDVFVWDGDSYEALPHALSLEISSKYFDYLDAMAVAYEHIGGETL